MADKMELLAPAGGMDAFIAAVQSGADAVYLGGTAFSARAGAKNFDNIALQEVVRYAHLRGVRVFVTLNTLIKENEMQRAADFAAAVYNVGADALIIQDFGLAGILLKELPGLPLHASTQMSVHNLDGAKRLQELGFRRVVLARELSEKQIAHICANTRIETEVFVHGALCYCYSGQCLFSSMIGGRSGNRGRCAQPCRLPYTLMGESNNKLKEGYLLSPKDLCLIDQLDKLQKCGVTSLKIEGRLKPPGYVAAISGIYRKYLDHPGKVSKEDLDQLLDAFNRSGFTKGHFARHRGKELMSYETPTNIAQGTNFKQLEHLWSEGVNLRKVKVTAQITIQKGKLPILCLRDQDGNTITTQGEQLPEQAVNMPLTEERIKTQMEKLGATPFELEKTDIRLDDGLMLPASQLNALRRNAADALAELRIKRGIPGVPTSIRLDTQTITKEHAGELDIFVQVYTTVQAKAALRYPIKRLYAPASVLSKLKDINTEAELVAVLPDILPDGASLPEADTASLLTGVYGTEYRLSAEHRVYGDFRLNVFNSYAVQSYAREGFNSLCLSPELNLKEITALTDHTDVPCEIIAYGRLPLMVTKECVIKGCTEKCKKGSSMLLKDRTGTLFPVLCAQEVCANLILNAKPIYLADKLKDLKKSGVRLIRLLFTIENENECDTILHAFFDSFPPGADALLGQNAFTRGHLYRGVE